MVAPQLPAKLDHQRIGRIEPIQRLAILDGVHHRRRHALLEALRLMGVPFEIAVEFARRRHDRDLADARRNASLLAQIGVDGAMKGRSAGAVQLYAAWPLQPGDGRPRRGSAIIGLAASVIEILAPGQGQAEPRLAVHIRRPVRLGRWSRNVGGGLRQRTSGAKGDGQAKRQRMYFESHGFLRFVMPPLSTVTAADRKCGLRGGKPRGRPRLERHPIML